MHNEDNPLAGGQGTPAPDSPLARLRRNYEARQEADPDRYLDVWEDGQLVAKIGRSSDLSGARSALRTAAMLTANTSTEIEVTTDDLADLIAVATTSLHYRDDNGDPQPMLADGLPLRFDARFSTAIGVPEANTPRGAVIVAFTDGEPPQLDATRMLLFAVRVATVLAGGRVKAEAAVGEASAPRS